MMVCPCCVANPCDQCLSCDFPGPRAETVFSEIPAPCAGAAVNHASFRSQSCTMSLPAGVSWNPGYPDKIEQCKYCILEDAIITTCCVENCTVNGIPGQAVFYDRHRLRYRLLSIKCPTDTEPASVVDLTDTCLNGNLQIEYSSLMNECEGVPDCAPWLEFYSDPVPVCNPLP